MTGGPLKIFIADDEPSVRDSVGYALNQEGFEELLARMLLIGGIDIAPEPGSKQKKLVRFFSAYDALRAAAPASDYDLNKRVREVTQA